MSKATQQEYLKNLLGKHQGKGRTAQTYLQKAEAGYQTQIKMGKYQIKQGVKIPHRKARSISKVEIENMRQQRKNLQKNLELIDSRLGEITQSEDKKNIIDEKERLKFVSQMAKARKQQERKRSKYLEDQLQKEKQAKEKFEEQMRIETQKERTQKKQELMKRAESMEVVRKNKKEQFQNQKKILKTKIEEKILSERMIDKFKQVQALNLEDRKRKLAQIRSLHQPLTKSDFQIHLQKLQKLKSQKSRVNESKSRYMTGDTTKFYKSSWYQKTKEQPMKFGDDVHVEELDHVKQMKDKLKKYGQHVRQNFKPEINKKKAKQLSMKNKSAPIVKNEDLRQLGLKYLEYSKLHNDPNKKDNSEDQDDKPKAFKHKNYLEEIKKKSKGTKNATQFVSYIKNKKGLSKIEKAQKILEYVEGLERKAKAKEQKDRVNHVMLDEELDNLYMEAIAIKMSMLNKEDSEQGD